MGPVTFHLGHRALLRESGDADQSLRSRSSMESDLVWSWACDLLGPTQDMDVVIGQPTGPEVSLGVKGPPTQN